MSNLDISSFDRCGSLPHKKRLGVKIDVDIILCIDDTLETESSNAKGCYVRDNTE